MKIICAALAITMLATPALSAECLNYDVIFPEVVGAVAMSPEEIAATAGLLDLEGITRGFMVPGDVTLTLGLEVAGCLLPPIAFALEPAAAGEPEPKPAPKGTGPEIGA